ncbi:hypothetical protein [Komagataeibacter sp. NFXK3]
MTDAATDLARFLQAPESTASFTLPDTDDLADRDETGMRHLGMGRGGALRCA